METKKEEFSKIIKENAAEEVYQKYKELGDYFEGDWSIVNKLKY